MLKFHWPLLDQDAGMVRARFGAKVLCGGCENKHNAGDLKCHRRQAWVRFVILLSSDYTRFSANRDGALLAAAETARLQDGMPKRLFKHQRAGRVPGDDGGDDEHVSGSHLARVATGKPCDGFQR